MKKVFFSLVGFLLLAPAAALAADSGCSGFEAIFGSLSGQSGNPTEGLPKICTAAGAISWATNLGLAFAGVIAVVFIIVGGYMYLTSGGNEEAAEKGRKVLTNSIIGLLIIILAATIVRVVVSTLDTGSGSTPNVTSTITYGGEVNGGGGGGGGSDVAALSKGVNISSTSVTANIDKASEAAIKSACGVQSIGSNVALRADINGTALGSPAPLVLNGSSYTASLLIASGTFNSQTDCLTAYVCNQMVAEAGKCGQ